MKAGKPLIAIILLLSMILASYPMITTSTESTIQSVTQLSTSNEAQIPNIDLTPPESYGYNVGPAFPAVIVPGSSDNVDITLRIPVDNITDINLVRVYFNKQLNALVEDKKYPAYQVVNNTTIRLISPGESLEPGLYDLIIITSSGERLVVPRSVWVIDPESIAEAFTFMHISDVHFGAGSPNITVGQNRRFVGYLMSSLLGVNAILNTGDEADTASDNQYKNSLAFRYMFAYEIPMFMNPGNHDYPNSNFIKYYGDTVRYALIGDKILIISINTDGEVGHADNTNLTFLENVLQEYSNIPIKIVMMHHPVFYYQGTLNLTYNSSNPLLSDPNENRGSAVSFYWGSDMNLTREFLRLVEQYNVTMVLAGHIHRDQYVIYHSNWTGHNTYFQTTTTLAHGTGTYQGFQVVSLNLTTGEPSYPLAPPWFIGYEDHYRRDVYNSIPLTLPQYAGRWKDQFGNNYLYGWYHQGITGIVFALYNMMPNIEINRTVVLSFPWPQNYSANLRLLDSENGTVQLVSSLYSTTLDRMFMALHFNLKPKSMVKFVLYTEQDTDAPEISLKRTIPRSPGINKPIKAYINVIDNGWGVEAATANATVDRGTIENFKFYKFGENVYIAEFKVSSEYMANITIHVQAVDYAGHIAEKDITINLAGPLPPPPETTTPVETTSPAETTTTSPPAETTGTTTSPATTTQPEQTATTTSPQPTGTPTSPTGSTETPGEEQTTTGGQPKESNTLVLVVSAIVILATIVAIYYIKK